jgi:hypothetical protein
VSSFVTVGRALYSISSLLRNLWMNLRELMGEDPASIGETLLIQR